MKTRVYNLSKVKKNKKWLKNILLDKSDSSDSELESEAKSEECIRDMIRFHNLQKKAKREFESDPQLRQYQNYSSSLLANQSQQISLLASNKTQTKKVSKTANKPKKKEIQTSVTSDPPVVLSISNVETTSNTPESSSLEKTMKTEKIEEISYDAHLPDKILQTECPNVSYIEPSGSSNYSLNDNLSTQLPDDIFDTEESSGSVLSQTLSQPPLSHSVTNFSIPKCATAPTTPTSLSPSSSPIIPTKSAKRSAKKKANSVPNQEAIIALRRKRLWIAIARKEIPRAQKQKLAAKKDMINNAKKMANWCQREKRKLTLAHQKQFCRDQYSRARRLTKEMILYWKRFDKVEKDYRKRAEKEAQEQLKIDIELLEAKRQQRKLNFLITQTELYAHFMSRKLSKLSSPEDETQQNVILKQLEEENPMVLSSGVEDDFNAEVQKQEVMNNADKAFKAHQQQKCSFDEDLIKETESREMNLSEISLSEDNELPQPKIFEGLLKTYQIKGMNWLYNLYDKGINGILADEMGLGKTVQTIAFLATLAERLGVWGPFLIIAPASTLHNWQQELTKFIPKFKVLPYWGNPNDRKVLRKFWNQKYLHREEASFHVLVTSYQLVVQDVKYFQRIKWMYMVLDEAQAIKSTSSVRWKILLTFQCRNRLLLTGTPIQNTMAELWALLHFIMPTMFDSHEEFNEWFSKDIESHAENKTAIDEKHLSRLHMILKPFMLRRIKKDVENELSDKIEIKLYCGLTSRQLLLYKALKNKISIEDLMASSSSSSSAQTATSSLMNLVMQFRKVCNHPNLFERRDVRSPYFMHLDTYILPRLIFESGLCNDYYEFDSLKYKLIYDKLNIFNCDYVFKSIFTNNDSFKCFSFIRLINLSPNELNQLFYGNLIFKWINILNEMALRLKMFYHELWHINDISNSTQPLLIPVKTTLLVSNRMNCIDSSGLWSNLLFTWSQTNAFSSFYTFTKHTLHYKSESVEHRELRLKKFNSLNENCSHIDNDSQQLMTSPLRFHEVVHKARSPRVSDCEPTLIPSFLFILISKTNGLKISAAPRDLFCSNERAMRSYNVHKLGGSYAINHLLSHGDIDKLELNAHQVIESQKTRFFPSPLKGLLGCKQINGWSSILIPDKETLVTDSGKLKALDHLLNRLKNEGHRVLIYSQMTRMIDLLEEYMWHRKHTYMRLDGSSKISDRRDMVADFQTRSDIFVFLLSTRAGGLGINLTAADTVIFYDSDWNPTVDQQAMDRAHRLGQTKQVTVYRLVCKGTIEERILQRAQEKSEIQRMVISGGTFKPDTLKPTEVVSLLLDDEELERRFNQKQEEKKLQIEECGGTSFKSLKRKPRKELELQKVSFPTY